MHKADSRRGYNNMRLTTYDIQYLIMAVMFTEDAPEDWKQSTEETLIKLNNQCSPANNYTLDIDIWTDTGKLYNEE